jgi:hypothetical protein
LVRGITIPPRKQDPKPNPGIVVLFTLLTAFAGLTVGDPVLDLIKEKTCAPQPLGVKTPQVVDQEAA